MDEKWERERVYRRSRANMERIRERTRNFTISQHFKLGVMGAWGQQC